MTNSVLNRINATAAAFVEAEDINFNEATAVSGGRKLPEGKAFGRFISYIELGPQLNKNYPDKKPTNMFYGEFALFGKNKEGETFHTMEGGKMVPGIIRTMRYSVSNNLTTKANAFKLFKRMNPSKTAKHFAQLLNGTYIVPIVHNTQGEGDKKKEYVNIDTDNLMLAVDPVTDVPYNVPEIEDEKLFRIFLWNNPTKEDWDSLYIEGKNDEGKSKNWIQELILSSPDFPGSPLDMLLHGAGAGSALAELPSIDEPVQEPAEPAADLPVDKVESTPAESGDFGLPTL
ncbi:hypothetical protein [Pantoea phage LIMEzero]|uniref:Uncharacterized protein n=1 Tax=Pantoea phage LIMEzero TaxID=943335 RepID=F4N9S7_9CAUD|nr:hypothetical protein LIMEzero_ORF24 [Pantoea phage LIMEzero]CBY88555.1 hypothetical protein [Pantoea phage LIMEzero]